MPPYRLWHHDYLYEFAVRLEDGVVTGVVPVPFDFACDPDGRLPGPDYDSSPRALLRFVECPKQFCRFEPWVEGKQLAVGKRT